MLKTPANFVLGSKQSSTYPIRGRSCLGSLGREGRNYHASGFCSPAALLADVLSIRTRIFTFNNQSSINHDSLLPQRPLFR